jgi:hypothetical protein
MPVAKEQLFRPNGRPTRALANALSYYRCETVEDLQAKVAAKKLYLSELLKIKGCGDHASPSPLAQFLFGVPSKKEKIMEKVMNDLGAGI